MTPDDPLFQLVKDFAAAQAAGVVHDGPTATERARVEAEIDRWRQSGSATPATPRRSRVRRWCGFAAAAALLFVAGWWLWQTFLASNGPQPIVAVEHPLLQGRGRVVPVSNETRFKVLDADAGRVKLERGEIYVELPAEPGLRAEVETPAGTAHASCTRFYVHFDQPAHADANPVLAVVSLVGPVEVANAHGRAIGDAGEVVLAESTAAPQRHSSAAPPSHLHGVCPYTSALGLVYRPEVQEELGLSPVQKAGLERPGADELKEICDFFRGLRTLPREQWAARTNSFCDLQQKRLAEVLTADQQKRLRQIGLQQEGPFAIARPEVAAELKLIDEQRAQLQSVLKDYTAAYHASAAKGLTAADLIREVSELQQQASARLLALLSEEQRTQWREMTGKAFTLRRRA